MTGVQTRRTETGYKASVMWVIEQWIETPILIRMPRGQIRRGLNQGHIDLPWEISEPADPQGKATVFATMRDGYGEVSRGRSSPPRQNAEGRPPSPRRTKG